MSRPNKRTINRWFYDARHQPINHSAILLNQMLAELTHKHIYYRALGVLRARREELGFFFAFNPTAEIDLRRIYLLWRDLERGTRYGSK